jgi:hypothetical protein
MSVTRRVFLAIYSLIWIGACIGLIVMVWNDDEMLDLGVGDLSFQALFELENGDTARWVLTAILAALALLGVFTLGLALWRRQRGRGVMRIEQEDGGVTEISTEAVESLLADEIGRLPDVRRAEPRVRTVGDTVESEVGVTVESSATISQVTSEVTQVTTQILRDDLGLRKLRRPVVRINYEEISARPVARGGRTKPQATRESTIGEPPPLPRQRLFSSEERGDPERGDEENRQRRREEEERGEGEDRPYDR